MGAPSYEESNRERNLDYRMAALVLEDRFRGNEGLRFSTRARRRRPTETEIRRARRAEAEATRIETKTRALVADMQLWYRMTNDVEPLRGR